MSKQTVLKQIITKFNAEFDKQKFLDWFNNSKESWIADEREQIQSAFESGMVKNNSSNRYISDIEAEKYYNQTYDIKSKSVSLDFKDSICEGCSNYIQQCTCFESSKNDFLNTVK
jgi:hypothetical protein